MFARVRRIGGRSTRAFARLAREAKQRRTHERDANAGVVVEKTSHGKTRFQRLRCDVRRAREAGKSWVDALLDGATMRARRRRAETLTRAPFQPVWLRQGAMDAAREAERAAARVDPRRALRHAGASRMGALMHAKTREWYGRRVRAVYRRIVVKQPFATAMFSSVSKCVASDVFVQIVVEERSANDLDWNRVLSFFVLGVTYVGAFQYRLYNYWLKPLNDAWRPKYGLALSTGVVVMVDQVFVQPFLYLPTFLCIKIVSEGATRLVDVPREAFGRWIETGPDTMSALWAVWVPAQAINFAFVPKHLTIPWMNLVGTMWNGVLSYMYGAAAEKNKLKLVVVESNDDE